MSADTAAPALPLVFYPGPSPAPPPDSDDESGDEESPQDLAGLKGPLARPMVSAVVAAVLVVLIVVLVFWTRRPGGVAGRETLAAPETLEQRLAARGWVVHFMHGCSHCERQAGLLPGLFGEAGTGKWTYCPGGPGCQGATAFPFWRNSLTGATRVGFQDAAALREMADGAGPKN